MMGNNGPTSGAGGASVSDVLTAIKNIVIALANDTQTFLNVQGAANAANISTPTLVINQKGRVATVSILTAGSTQGTIYDAASTTDLSKPIVPIVNTVGVFSAAMPVSFGILVVPGTGQVVSISYSVT